MKRSLDFAGKLEKKKSVEHFAIKVKNKSLRFSFPLFLFISSKLHDIKLCEKSQENETLQLDTST
jgi:hypothetical protein